MQTWTAVDLRIYCRCCSLWGSFGERRLARKYCRCRETWYRPKHVLLQAALGDAQVTTVAAELLADILPQLSRRPVMCMGYLKGLCHGMGREHLIVLTKGTMQAVFVRGRAPVTRDRDIPPTDGKDTHDAPVGRNAQEQLDNFWYTERDAAL